LETTKASGFLAICHEGFEMITGSIQRHATDSRNKAAHTKVIKMLINRLCFVRVCVLSFYEICERYTEEIR
jgi:hypothetical protein